MSRPAFERIPLSTSEQQAYMDRELELMRTWLENARSGDGDGLTVKRLQGALLRAGERLIVTGTPTSRWRARGRRDAFSPTCSKVRLVGHTGLFEYLLVSHAGVVVTHRGQNAAPSDGDVRPVPSAATETSGRGLPPGWHWLLPLAVAASTAAWLSGAMSGKVTGDLRILLLVCGALFTTTAAGVPLWQQARASRAQADAVAAAQSARAAMRVVMQDALDPFATLLLQLATATSEQKPLLRGAAIQLALTTIAQISEPGGVTDPEVPRRLRVSYFALDPGPPRTLVPQAYAGRSGAPTVSFDLATSAGQFLLLIADDGWMTIDDIQHLPVPVWWDEEHQHRTFAAGPVTGPDNEPAGLLVVDALAPGGLATLDLPLVRLLTHLLSLALQL